MHDSLLLELFLAKTLSFVLVNDSDEFGGIPERSEEFRMVEFSTLDVRGNYWAGREEKVKSHVMKFI
jgi:hypothetical protein